MVDPIRDRGRAFRRYKSSPTGPECKRRLTEEEPVNEETHSNPDEAGEGRQRWAREAQEALDRTADALKTAWEASRDSRMSALEAAKRAARELGDALERGVEAARQRWEAESPDEDAEGETDAGGSSVDVDDSGPEGNGSEGQAGGPPPTTPPPPQS